MAISSVNAGNYEDGLDAGEAAAENLWSQDCDDAWGFEDLSTTNLIEGDYEQDWDDNPSEKAFKRGARKGVKKIIRQVEKECFNDDVGQCLSLGTDAAEEIASEFCDTTKFRLKKPDYKANCREEHCPWRG